MDVTHVNLPYFGKRSLSLAIAGGIAFAGGCYLIYQLAKKQKQHRPIPAGKRCELANCACPKHDPESYWLYQQKLDRLNEKRKHKKSKVKGSGYFDDAVYEQKAEEIEYKFPVEVFLRIRPMVGKEVEDGHQPLEYTVKTSKKKGTQSLVLNKGSKLNERAGDDDDQQNMSAAQKRLHQRLKSRDRATKYQGFKMVLEPSDHNVRVFSRCILPAYSTILGGEQTCVFAYGHTGSGKTHTIYGYPPDRPGLFQLFAGQIIEHIKSYEGIFVEVRFTEMYQGKLYDLLTQPKTECEIRENKDGSNHISLPPELGDDGLLRERTVTSVRMNNLQELLQLIADGINSRKCGLSTLHDKSSRSHAFMEFELVNKELVDLRRRLIEIKAQILLKQCLEDRLGMQEKLPGHKEFAKVVAEAAKEYVSTQERLSGKVREGKAPSSLRSDLQILDKKLKKCQKRIEEVLNDHSHPFKECIGGTMCFVDLAGNEYGRDVTTKDKQEERERNEINKSLLALKECIRALHSKKSHVGYRGSKLTQYLKKYLGGDGAHAIMINCIGSSKEYQKQTVNTLQYAALMAKI